MEIFFKNGLKLQYCFIHGWSGGKSTPRGYDISSKKNEGLVEGEKSDVCPGHGFWKKNQGET